jgi:hypothetical protein
MSAHFFCCSEVLGDFSGEVGFDTISQFSCYDISGEVSGKFRLFCVWTFFATTMVDFAPNGTFLAILVHYGSKVEINVKIDFAPNGTFFATLVHYESKSKIEGG